MEIVVKQIKDNLDLKLIKTNKFKLVDIQLNFLMELDYNDIAAYNLLLNLLITRNNTYNNMSAFNAYLENNYGMTFTGGYLNRGNVAIMKFLSRAINSKYSMNEDLLSKQINTIKDCLFNPYINEESLNEVKMIYIQKLKEKNNHKTYILKKKINEMLGHDNPYGVNIESDIEKINNVTLEKIFEVYNKLLSSDCKIYVCGDVDEEELCARLVSLDLHNYNKSILNLSYLKEIEKKDIQVFDSKFLQSAISFLYECDIKYNDRLYYPLKVFLEMLNYDLFNVIREKYNFCYYISAMSNNYLNTVEIASEIESKNLDKVIELVEEIIEGYSRNFDEERFNLCKNKILTYISNSTDSPRELIELYFGFDFTNTVSSIEELEASYVSVSKEDVINVSKMMKLKIVSILKEDTNNG